MAFTFNSRKKIHVTCGCLSEIQTEGFSLPTSLKVNSAHSEAEELGSHLHGTQASSLNLSGLLLRTSRSLKICPGVFKGIFLSGQSEKAHTSVGTKGSKRHT